MKLWLWLDRKSSASSTILIFSAQGFVAPLFCFDLLVAVQELGVSTKVKQMVRICAANHSSVASSETVQVHWDAVASGCSSDRLGSLWLGCPQAELKPSPLAPS